ncbi:MAG: ABC transporter permease [Anaerolineales bacterium]
MKNKLKRFFSNAELLFGILIILAFAVVAIAAPRIAPPEEENPYYLPRDGYRGIPEPPDEDHLLGTLPRQYDVFYGIIWGTRMAFLVGLSITLGRTLIGGLLGLLSGYFGGLLDGFIMRITDAFMSIPAVAAGAIMYALFGEIGSSEPPVSRFLLSSKNEQIIVITLVMFGWMQYARLLRGNVLSEREKEYVKAAISIGSPNKRIIFKHLLPNSIRGLFVMIASDIGAMVALVSVFYFIGLIGDSPYGFLADWGLMLSASRDWIVSGSSKPFEYWYTYVPAISAIVLFTVGWSMIGDGLRDLLDPRRR